MTAAGAARAGRRGRPCPAGPVLTPGRAAPPPPRPPLPARRLPSAAAPGRAPASPPPGAFRARRVGSGGGGGGGGASTSCSRDAGCSSDRKPSRSSWISSSVSAVCGRPAGHSASSAIRQPRTRAARMVAARVRGGRPGSAARVRGGGPGRWRRRGAPAPRGALCCGPPSSELWWRPGRGRRGFREPAPPSPEGEEEEEPSGAGGLGWGCGQSSPAARLALPEVGHWRRLGPEQMGGPKGAGPRGLTLAPCSSAAPPSGQRDGGEVPPSERPRGARESC